MRPVTNNDIAQALSEYIGEVPNAYTHVTLTTDGGMIATLTNPPQNKELTKTQAERLWRKLANFIHLPIHGVKKVQFSLQGAGNLTPMIQIEMKAVAKPMEKTREFILSKRNGEEYVIMGRDFVHYELSNSDLIVFKVPKEDEFAEGMLLEVQKKFSEEDARAIVIAIPEEDDIHTYKFEEVSY